MKRKLLVSYSAMSEIQIIGRLVKNDWLHLAVLHGNYFNARQGVSRSSTAKCAAAGRVSAQTTGAVRHKHLPVSHIARIGRAGRRQNLEILGFFVRCRD